MPTVVHFIGAEQPIRVTQDYGFVSSTLSADRGQFKRDEGGDKGNLVTIYKSAVAYIEAVSEGEILRASDLT